MANLKQSVNKTIKDPNQIALKKNEDLILSCLQRAREKKFSLKIPFSLFFRGS